MRGCKAFLAVFTALAVYGYIAVCHADAPGSELGRVQPKSVLYGGAAISASAPISVTNAAKACDAIRVNNTECQSVRLSINTTETVSVAVHVQGSMDGTTWTDFDPDEVLVTVTGDYTKIKSLSVPAVPYLRFQFNPDTAVPNSGYTVEALTLGGW